MDDDNDLFSLSILGPISIETHQIIDQLPIESECIFTQEADIEDGDYFIPA